MKLSAAILFCLMARCEAGPFQQYPVTGPLANNAMFTVNMAALTPTNVPNYAYSEAHSGVQTIESSTDGTSNFLQSSSLSSPNQILFAPIATYPVCYLNTTFKFTNAAAPSKSYIYFAIGSDVNGYSAGEGLPLEYELVFYRGTTANSAAYVQRTETSSQVIIGSGIGTDSTFTSGVYYSAYCIVTGGTISNDFQVAIQRSSDGNWLNSSAAWQSGSNICLNVIDSSSPLALPGRYGVNSYVTSYDAACYQLSFSVGATHSPTWYRTVEASPNPVLTNGTVYAGFTNNALAAPSVCVNSNNTGWVMTVSMWNIASNAWVSAFFASTNLTQWSYVANSIQYPSSGNYIIGNGGLAWFKGNYWWNYNQYPQAGGPTSGDVFIVSGTTLTSWSSATTIATTYYYDPSLVVNPNTGLLECWMRYSGSPNNISLSTSANGTTWSTPTGALAQPTWVLSNFGEPNVWYIGAARYLSYDAAQRNGQRHTELVWDPAGGTNWQYNYTVKTPNLNNAWEAIQCFDACELVADIGDGHGFVPRIIGAGGNVISSTDNTSSSLYLGWINTITSP